MSHASIPEPRNPDFDSAVRASFDKHVMMETLGIELVEIEPGRVVLEYAHDERFTQQQGFAHAGLVATAMDTACGYAAMTLMSEGSEVLSVEYKVNFLRPASSTRYRAVATVVRSGRTLSVSDAVTTAVDNDRPIATMTATLIAVDTQ